MKLSEIKPNPLNPRIIKDDKFKKLCNSISEFPKMMALRPMIVNDDMILLGGNMRLRALQELGFKEIPDEWVKKASELTEEEQRQFIIKDNVGFGEWDWDMLANEWDSDKLNEWGLDVPIFDQKEIKDLSDQIQASYKIEVTCQDENAQEQTYNTLIEMGLTCRILTL